MTPRSRAAMGPQWRTLPRHPVPGIEPGDLVGFGQRRVIERVLDEIVDSAFEVEHRLADMDQLSRAFTENVHPKQPAGLGREDHLHHAAVEPHDVPARGRQTYSEADCV